MTPKSINSLPGSVVPMMRYRDLTGSLDWLCNAFGFDRDCVVRDSDGAVIYAQLVLGRGMVMLGPVGDSEFDELMRQPSEVGGTETQSCYLAVKDIDQHYEHAKAAGAKILIELTEDGAGGQGYCCRDPGGHIWNFGTYDPWEHRPAHDSLGEEVADDVEPLHGTLGRIARTSAHMVLGAGICAVGFVALSLNAPHLIDRAQSTVRELTYAATRAEKLRPQPAAWTPGDAAVPAPMAAVQPGQDSRLRESERKLQAAERATRGQVERLQIAANKLRAAEKERRIQNERLQATERKLRATEQAERMQVERLQETEHRLRAAEEAGRIQELRLEESQNKLRAAAESERDMSVALAREQSARQAADEALRQAQQELTSEQQARVRAEQAALSMSEQLARERLSGRERADRPPAKKAPQKLAALEPPVVDQAKMPSSTPPPPTNNATAKLAPVGKDGQHSIPVPIKKETEWEEFRDAKEAAERANAAKRAREARARREERRKREAAERARQRAAKPKPKPKQKTVQKKGWPFSEWN